jgi:CelD/BcsL family acetyltransferase involved in cellulose biosynthesis
MRRPSPFLLHGWIEAWARHYVPDGDLRVHVAERSGRLVGAVPLFVHRRRGLRVAEFLGGDQAALADLLVAPDAPAAVAPRLAAEAAAGDHDFADLFGLSGGSRLAAAVETGSLTLIERVEAPVLDLAAGWDAVYEAKTSSKRRNLHRRRLRQLSELGEVAWRFARTPEELRSALEDAFALHDLRWHGRPDGSRFATPTGMRFHQEAIAALAESDIPRIVTLTLDGRPIAFHYYLAFEGRMYVHRLAFDPELARFSPGLLATLEALRLAGEEGLQLVEYLGGDERYKLELSDRLEPLYQGLGLTGSAPGRAAVAARRGAIAVRKRLKRSEALRRLYVDGLAPSRRLYASLRGRGTD